MCLRVNASISVSIYTAFRVPLYLVAMSGIVGALATASLAVSPTVVGPSIFDVPVPADIEEQSKCPQLLVENIVTNIEERNADKYQKTNGSGACERWRC